MRAARSAPSVVASVPPVPLRRRRQRRPPIREPHRSRPSRRCCGRRRSCLGLVPSRQRARLWPRILQTRDKTHANANGGGADAFAVRDCAFLAGSSPWRAWESSRGHHRARRWSGWHRCSTNECFTYDDECVFFEYPDTDPFINISFSNFDVLKEGLHTSASHRQICTRR